MISVAEALAHVTSSLRPLAAEQVALSDALGRVLAEDVASRLTQPPVDVSAMDGYAVRAADVAGVPVTLKVIGESPAGGAFDGVLGAGQAVRTFTGAMVADGADAIVIQEVTDAEGDTVIVKESTAPGTYIRRAGQDFRAGQVLLAAGKVLTARDVGLAAAMNVPWLKVRRRPRIAILATGDEVVMPGEPLARNQIISSNSVALDAYVRALGGVPIILGIARDDEESLHAMLAGAEGADMLVTIGGASVGDHDLVRKVLGDEGLDLTFYKVAMRPGKPLIFGRLGNVPVLGMPGNPVSAGVSSIIFLGPAMEVMLGLRRPGEDAAEPAPTALLGRHLEANDQRQDYLRAKLGRDDKGSLVATPFDKQDSAMMARLAAADCLVVRPPNAPPAEAGERVEIVPLATGLLSI
ncbi:MAG: molybdopterin molybdotransferase MoeA [Rhodospirillales bacterium]|jgi:molybdopterin molybdotransferase|nr:molybdopterin molybdotransferase MoeA [Rhodospirillales bacterium]MDP6773947.1 molybdopterin molybdotransferase MoeA [Rhodospirillales bacterium]